MKKIAGLWIDHRKALIMVVTDKREEVKLVVSRVEKQPRRSGDSPFSGSYESQTVPADDIRERKFSGDLGIYYDAVIECIRYSDSILIFGPGEAKAELKKRLIRHRLGERIVRIETADKMTDRQVAVKIRQYFQ